MDRPNAAGTLTHYGVKGMKWGIRRSKEQLGSRDADSEDVVVSKKAKTTIRRNKSTDSLSNKELKDLVERMNLEQQYSRLKHKTPKDHTKKFVIDLLKNVATQQVTKLISDQVSKQVKKKFG